MKVVCFDLDDTLYKEIDYLHSAYKDIARELWCDDWVKWYLQMLTWYDSGENVFERVCSLRKSVGMNELLNMYRYDFHDLTLSAEVEDVLRWMKAAKIKIGLITDGRKLTQENKVKALGLDFFVDNDMMVVSETFGSEKPSLRNYQYFIDKFPECEDFSYVGDNPEKDFLAPNKLGWKTICLLDNGRNIRMQRFDFEKNYLPQIQIKKLSELVPLE